jgi:hypothetical protein
MKCDNDLNIEFEGALLPERLVVALSARTFAVCLRSMKIIII